MKILFLSFTCEDIGVAMVTNMISQLQESFPLRRAAGSFEISFTKWDGTVTGDFLDELSNFHIEFEEHSGRFAEKKSCVLWRHFISIYKINRTLHGRLRIRILSSRAESIQHSKIKFVSPRGHVISSISSVTNDNPAAKLSEVAIKSSSTKSYLSIVSFFVH